MRLSLRDEAEVISVQKKEKNLRETKLLPKTKREGNEISSICT